MATTTPTPRNSIQKFEPHVDPLELKKHPENPRLHPQHQIDALQESLDTIGWVDAVKVNTTTGHIIDGHARVDQAIANNETVPVLWITLTEDEERYMLATHDPIAALAEFDSQLLAGLVDTINIESQGLLGFLEDQIELGNLDTEPEPEQHPEPPPPETPTTIQGDIWILGKHRVMCGDSTSPTDIEQLMDGKQADIVWTDPPYGVNYVGKTSDALTIQNDGNDEFEAILDGAFDSILTAAKPGAPVYVAAPAGPQSISFATRLQDRDIFRQRLVWVKNTLVMGHSDYHYKHEDIYFGYVPGYTGRPGRGGPDWAGDNAQTTVLEYDKPARSEHHPTTKPVDLIIHCIKNHKANHVLDLFGGSGSTLIAAHNTNRTAFLMELDPKYVDVICARYQQHTGEQPINAATGNPHNFLETK